jgi:putative ABC transport system permease protein
MGKFAGSFAKPSKMNDKSTRPPLPARRIISALRRYEDEFATTGDFDEEYLRIAVEKGKIRAHLWYWWQAVYLIPAHVKFYVVMRRTMLKHLVIVAIRNIKRNKGHSFINIAGLAIGIASSLMLVFWAMDECRYDRFHHNAKNIFRIVQERKTDQIFKTPSTPSPLAPALVADYPEIERAVRIRHTRMAFFSDDSKNNIFGEGGLFADPEVLQVFTFPLKEGNPRTALAGPQSIIISENMARACFGKQDPMGKIISATNGDTFQVTGVMENVPKNSHLNFDYMIPTGYLLDRGHSLDRWNLSDSLTYIMLREHVDYKELNHRLESYVQERTPNSSSRLVFQPLTEIHLRSLEGGGPIVYVWIAISLAWFILIVACINFMNLSTARFAKRSLEVGMRKVMGARRPGLIGQFFGESLVFSFASAFFALGLVYIFLPIFNRFLEKEIGFQSLGTIPAILAIAAVVFFTGIVSGIYPAVFLSSFPPVRIFKGFSRSTEKMMSVRRFLVVFQFAISVVLILLTLVVSKQLHFIQNLDLGLKKENLVFFQLGDNPQVEPQTIKHILNQSPAISFVTATNAPLLWLGIETTDVSWEGKKPGDIMNVQLRTVDFDYLRTFGMEMKEGRFFSEKMSTDVRQGFILNESAVKVMGLDSPVGKWFSLDDRKGEIIGVVKDFHHHSIHEAIEPVLFLMEQSWIDYIFVRIRPGRTAEALRFISDNWRQINPDRPFRLHFFDEEINRLYRSEKELGRFINILSVLAVFISCLGLFGLVSYASEQKTKEIGIRKVLGASAVSIQILLSTEFLKWVLIANGIAWPVSYFVIQKWLQNFAYRTPIGIEDFLFAGGLVFAVAMITISFQTIKASVANPVDSLRYE